MAKVHLNKLQKQYEGIEKTGNVYSEIVKQIIDNNINNVNRSLYRKAKYKWQSYEKKYRTDKEIKFVLPDEEDVIPQRAIQIKKAAEKGQLIRETLSNQLTKDLRDALFKIGDKSYIIKRGEKAGRINPNLIKVFEKQIGKSFEGYTKKDKQFGMPGNIHTIAVTEMRGSISDIKDSFTQKMIEENPSLIIKKRWVHNDSLSRKPRRGHKQLHGVTINYNDLFKVNTYKESKGKLLKTGIVLMKRPYDSTAPVGEIIGCNCDFDIIVLKKKRF